MSFFFFKHKTAYEMRISDWSSDVCSSDLDSKKVTAASQELAAIAGQRPIVTHARKSIATFKLREGMPIGAKVTLRRERMYEFLDRLEIGRASCRERVCQYV